MSILGRWSCRLTLMSKVEFENILENNNSINILKYFNHFLNKKKEKFK